MRTIILCWCWQLFVGSTTTLAWHLPRHVVSRSSYNYDGSGSATSHGFYASSIHSTTCLSAKTFAASTTSTPVNIIQNNNDDTNLVVRVEIDGSTFQTGDLTEKIINRIQQNKLGNGDADLLMTKYLALLLATQQAVETALAAHDHKLKNNNDIDSAIDNNNWLSEQVHQPIWTFRQRNYTSLIDLLPHYESPNNFNVILDNLAVVKLDDDGEQLPIEDLMQALDPQGLYRQQAAQMPDFVPIDQDTLKDLALDNAKRAQESPVQVASHENAYVGNDCKGYSVLNANDLVDAYKSEASTDGGMPKLWKQVMQGLVLHGCLLVDVSDYNNASQLWSQLWQAMPSIFDNNEKEITLHELAAVPGMPHAKIGFASYPGMSFLETRIERASGNVKPKVTTSMDDILPQLMQSIAAPVAQAVVAMAVAASSVEANALDVATTWEKAKVLSRELVDDGSILQRGNLNNSNETIMSMSPHRLCCYSGKAIDDDNVTKWQEIFGAHTDSSFITLVPVAAVAGLDVWDEDVEEWYRPELAARKHYEENYMSQDNNDNEIDQYWHSRYMVLMPGEFLQVATRNEVPASVHRVVVLGQQSESTDSNARLSAPILLRGRPNAQFNVQRYLGSDMGYSLLQECNNMTMNEIHEVLQSK